MNDNLRKVPHAERLAAWSNRLGRAMDKLDLLDMEAIEKDKAFLLDWPSLDVTAIDKALLARVELDEKRIEATMVVRECWRGVARWWRRGDPVSEQASHPEKQLPLFPKGTDA